MRRGFLLGARAGQRRLKPRGIGCHLIAIRTLHLRSAAQIPLHRPVRPVLVKSPPTGRESLAERVALDTKPNGSEWNVQSASTAKPPVAFISPSSMMRRASVSWSSMIVTRTIRPSALCALHSTFGVHLSDLLWLTGDGTQIGNCRLVRVGATLLPVTQCAERDFVPLREVLLR